jgi:predicted ATPase
VPRVFQGNPFFAQTFLRSLVDKGILKYNLREMSWTYDIGVVCAENITPNVLDLISANITNLSQNVQVRALFLISAIHVVHFIVIFVST